MPITCPTARIQMLAFFFLVSYLYVYYNPFCFVVFLITSISFLHCTYRMSQMVLGIVDLLNQNIEVFTFSASWVTPAVLVILALLFRSPSTPAHDKEQPEGGHAHADFMGQAFTVSVLSAAVLRALLRVDAERWGVLAAYAWSLAGFAYIAQSRAITDALSFNFTSHTVFLAICVIACVLLIPLLAFIQWATKDAPRTHHRVKDDEVKGY